MSASLLTTRRFAPLFWCQFFSAFNDNFLKNALVFLILYKIGGADADALVTFAGAIFIAPFFFLSSLGGEVADRYDKAVVAQRLKLAEIGVTALVSVGFFIQSLHTLFVALFLFGVIAALFGPIKYGILPDHLALEELPAGNALIEGATFLAILLGTIVAGIASEAGGDALFFSALIFALAVLCWIAALLIPPTGEAAPNLRIDPNIARSTAALLKDLWSDRRLRWGGLVVSWFWLLGAVALSIMPPMVKTVLGGTEGVISAYLAVFAIAIAAGSRLAAWLAGSHIVLLPVFAGAVLQAVFALDLGFAALGATPAAEPLPASVVLSSGLGLRAAVDFAGLAIAGGLFIVPAFAAVQAWAGADRRARVVAAVNILSAAFMAVGGIAVAAVQLAGAGTAGLFLGIGAACLAVSLAVGWTMPASQFRDLLRIVFQTVFRLEVKGEENLRKAGNKVIAAFNHVSFLDAGLALSLFEKEPLFAVDRNTAQKWWVKPFVRISRTIALDPLKPMAIRSLIEAVREGETLVIFPEGR
ncbi:MAG TPA: MFS transporter, partial [Methylocella sp.]|nr:MFS transporter [Methylocella sp.]